MRVALDMKDLPSKWYNVFPDLDFAVPPPMTPSGYPVTSRDLRPLAPAAIIDQELDRSKSEIPIPDGIRELYSEWRPTPLYRAERFERKLDTPARIFFKYEGSSFSGGHEANTAIAQAYYAALDGAKRVVTATGNGEWGASLAAACNYFNLRCRVYMIRSSYEEGSFGRAVMEVLGAEVLPSPGENTAVGRKMLSEKPDSVGSLSMALSEAFEDASKDEDTKFCWGTVMNHVALHQTIVGLEARLQMRRVDAYPDLIIGAVGGGTAFGGLALPFYKERKRGLRMIAVETASAPSLTKGRYAYDYADAGQLPVLLKMYTLGHGYVPPGIKAGGMRYHGISPLVSALYRENRIEARSCSQNEAFESGIMFARTEGIIPSPESSYAVKVVVDEARACKERKEKKNIIFVLNADSHLDMDAFRDFLKGDMEDMPFQPQQSGEAMDRMPDIVEK